MSARALMLQGTGSDVGKSVIVAGLCRIARRHGMRVAPFKPQNMSNNAAACADGGEIGRAQALQARAAGLEPHVDFNPVLLKPQSDLTAQVVVHGKVLTTSNAADFMADRETLLPAVLESFRRLSEDYDLILCEGAGSPAEVNLRERDIANMGFARAADVPVCLIGDIDRGGVIAAIAGTKMVLDEDDAKMIVGFLINKFRGDPALFVDGVKAIEETTTWPSFGVVPWLSAVAALPAEDAVALQRNPPSQNAKIKIAAPMLSRIANFDDADPLWQEPHVDFQFIPPGRSIPRDADVILLLGTKSTLGDLEFLRAQGWDHDIIAHARAGGRIVGVCGGFQMLGKSIIDDDGVDGPVGEVEGLGLLDMTTHMTPDKIVRQVDGRCAMTDEALTGYEIHMGRVDGPALEWPMLFLDDQPEGARSAGGFIEGAHLHGLFANDGFRRAWLQRIRPGAASNLDYESAVDEALDALADGLEASLDIDALFARARAPSL